MESDEQSMLDSALDQAPGFEGRAAGSLGNPTPTALSLALLFLTLIACSVSSEPYDAHVQRYEVIQQREAGNYAAGIQLGDLADPSTAVVASGRRCGVAMGVNGKLGIPLDGHCGVGMGPVLGFDGKLHLWPMTVGF